MAIVKSCLQWGLAFLLVGCGVNHDLMLSEGKRPVVEEGEFLKGTIETTDGKTIRLEDLRDKPVVVAFVRYGCGSCYEETQSFIGALSSVEAIPTKVHLISAMGGQSWEDAREMKATWGKSSKPIPWPFGLDPGRKIKEQYCGKGAYPCTVIQLPEKGIVEVHNEKSNAAKIIKVTGEWE